MGAVEGEFREVEAPERLVQTFQNHLQTLEFEDLGERTKLTQTMRFATSEERDTTMQYGVEEGAKGGSRRSTHCWRRSRREAGAVVACAVLGGHAHMLCTEVDCWVGERGRDDERPSRPAQHALDDALANRLRYLKAEAAERGGGGQR
jgi:Activator of Hsp90 ATPase homolog 1-like protein